LLHYAQQVLLKNSLGEIVMRRCFAPLQDNVAHSHK